MNTDARTSTLRLISFVAIACIVVGVFLVEGMMADGLGIPFEVTYHPHPLLELLLGYCALHLLAVLYVVMLPGHAPARLRRSVRWGHVAALAVGAVAYIIYHLGHPGERGVMSFTSYRNVVPYHRQLATQFFNALLAASLILLLSGRDGRWVLLAAAAINVTMCVLVA